MAVSQEDRGRISNATFDQLRATSARFSRIPIGRLDQDQRDLQNAVNREIANRRNRGGNLDRPTSTPRAASPTQGRIAGS